MRCELCHENEASVELKQVVNGVSRELHVCKGCAEKNVLDVDAPESLSDLLFGVGKPDSVKLDDPTRVCPVCRMRLSEFRTRSRLGCPSCYTTFDDELSQVLESMHKGPRHEGKVPVKSRHAVERMTLDSALQAAVQRQDFEEAARLRDLLIELDRKGPDAPSASQEGGSPTAL